jgi:hypothetical protein
MSIYSTTPNPPAIPEVLAGVILGFLVSQPQIDQYNLKFLACAKLSSLMPSLPINEVSDAVSNGITQLEIWRQYLGETLDRGTLQ